MFSKLFKRDIDPMSEILVSMGANGCIHSFIEALVEPGDEVVLIEPCFPMYLDHLYMTNATVKSIPLEFNGETWKIDLDLLRKTLSDKTKLFLFNNPNNPIGKNFSR